MQALELDLMKKGLRLFGIQVFSYGSHSRTRPDEKGIKTLQWRDNDKTRIPLELDLMKKGLRLFGIQVFSYGSHSRTRPDEKGIKTSSCTSLIGTMVALELDLMKKGLRQPKTGDKASLGVL